MVKLVVILGLLSLVGCASSDNPYNKKWKEMGLNGRMVPSTVYIGVERTADGGLVIKCDKPCRGLIEGR